MKISSSKAKGRRLQNWVRDKLLEVFPELAGHITSATMGETGVDIKLSPTAIEKIPYAIECKNKETGFTALYDAYIQALNNSHTGLLTPIVFVKQNNRPVLAILDGRDLIKLIKEANNAR